MIAGIILAAGSSARLGRPKQLLSLHGEPLLRYTARRVLATAIDTVLVVLPAESGPMQQAIADLPVRIVPNPQAALGQSTSLIAGLTALGNDDVEAVIVFLGDQPGVDPTVVNRLVARWHESSAAIVCPEYNDGIGNPVLFDRRMLPALHKLTGDTGARQVIQERRQRGDVETVPVDAPAPLDVDTEDDFAAILAAIAAPWG